MALRAVECLGGEKTLLPGPLVNGVQPIEGRHIPQKYYGPQFRRTTDLALLYDRAVHQASEWRMNLLGCAWMHAGLCQRFRDTI